MGETGFHSNGVAMIAAERQRQVEVEGWTGEHDAQHTNGEIAKAAAVYAMCAAVNTYPVSRSGLWFQVWPWPWQWFKPKDRLRDLARAGALIAAEIDRVLAEEAQKATVDQILAKTQRATP